MKPHNTREELEDALDDHGITYDQDQMELIQVDFSNLNCVLPTEEGGLETNLYIHLTLRMIDPEGAE